MAKQTTAVAKPAAVSAGLATLLTGTNTPLQPLQNIGGATSPYVMFVHPQSPQYPNILSALGKIPNGTAVLVSNGEYTRLDPFEFILLTEQPLQYFADFDSQNNVVGAALVPVERIPQNEKGDRYKECIEAIVLVVQDSELQPARVSFRGPKCPAVKTACSARQDCDLPEFGGRSKEHGVIAKSKTPKFLWHTISCTVTEKDPKRTDRGQKEYQELSGVARLTTVNVLAEFAKVKSELDFLKACEDCLTDHNSRVEEISAIASRS